MTRRILAASVAIAALAMSMPAYAWTNTNTGPGPNQIVDGGPGAQATAGASAAAVSGARATATGGRAYGGSAAGGTGYGGAGGRGGSSNVTVNNSSGGGSDRGYYISSAIAPSFGTTNQCGGTAASVGGQFPVFGLSFGGTNMDDICRAQRLGENDVAREMFCDASSDFRRAALRVGTPCMVDRPKFQEMMHPPVVEPVAAPFVPSPWCRGATRAQRAANPASCGRG